MSTTVAYVRISSDKTGAGLGVERQAADCRELALKLGLGDVEVIPDNDLSAYSGKPRPGYERLKEGLHEGRRSALVVWHVDRLTRSLRDLEDLVDLVNGVKVTVHTVKGGEIDLSTPEGRLQARMLGMMARYESEHRSDRVRRKLDANAEAGIAHGGPRPYDRVRQRRRHAGTDPDAQGGRDRADRRSSLQPADRRRVAPARRPQGRRLDVTLDTYATRVREESIYRVTRREAEQFAALEREVMLRELQLSMRAEADSYVTALRAAFDSAMADFTKLVDLGLTVGSTPQEAIELGSTAVDAWKKVTTGVSSTKVLDGVAGLRIRLSMALGIMPINLEAYAGPVDYGVCFGVGRGVFDEHGGVRRWLAAAATGTAQLRSIAEVESVLGERQRRALNIPVPSPGPTDDDPRPPSSPATPKRRPGIVDSDAEPRPDDLATAGF